MKFPEPLRKLNNKLGEIGGVLCFAVAAMYMIEAILRYVFRSPTSWMEDYASYIHCLALFMACAYTYQVHGHVGVDMFKNLLDKKTGGKNNRRAARILSVIGFIQTLFFLAIFVYSAIGQFMNATKMNAMTASTYPIPQAVLYFIMIAGGVLMLITVFCIVLSLLGGSDEFIE